MYSIIESIEEIEKRAGSIEERYERMVDYGLLAEKYQNSEKEEYQKKAIRLYCRASEISRQLVEETGEKRYALIDAMVQKGIALAYLNLGGTDKKSRKDQRIKAEDGNDCKKNSCRRKYFYGGYK